MFNIWGGLQNYPVMNYGLLNNVTYNDLTQQPQTPYNGNQNQTNHVPGATANPFQGQPGRLPEFFTDNFKG